MPKYPEEQIRNYAHQLWEKAGCPEGKTDDFWRQAEIELDAEGETNEPTTVPLLYRRWPVPASENLTLAAADFPRVDRRKS
jgi:hypothetical protein